MNLPSLSLTQKDILTALQDLRDHLQTALGDRLTSLILYGDAVRAPDFNARYSSVRLLLILRDTTVEILSLARAPIAEFRRHVRSTVMTMTEDDLERSCDVFPIQFLDIQECHKLICGRDVVSALTISDDHLRLRCEQELKNLMIRQRSVFLRHADNSAELARSVANSIGPLLRLLGVALTIKTGMTPDDEQELIAAIRDEFQLDFESLKTAVDLRESEDAACNAQTFGRYMSTVHDAAIAIDKLETSASDH